ncbi:MAG: guanylate kinase, partial [Gammaproteobacteria bacterium]|nr:guanylate kinase [Gammaproteobacteria bacterium]
GRGTDNATAIARRLRNAVDDMSHYNEFDYVIINDDFERAVADLQRILVGPANDLLASRPTLEPLRAELLG